MKKLNIKGASWDSVFLAGARVLTILFNILSTKILSIGLNLQEYGTYSQALLVSSIGTSLIAVGLSDALNYFFNKKKQDVNDATRHRIINSIFLLEIVLGLVFAAVVMLGQGLVVTYFDNPSLYGLLIPVAFLPTFSNLIHFYHVLYVSVGKAKMMSFFNLATLAIKITTIYLSVYVFQNLLWIFIVLLALDVAVLLVYHVSLAKNRIIINPFHSSPKHFSAILSYSLPMGVFAITSALTRDLDKLVIGRLADTEALAIYTNCSKVLPLDFLVTAFATVLIPYIVQYVTEHNKEQSVKLFSSYLKVGYYSVWILGTMVLVAPSAVISLLYTDDYLAGLTVFVLYIFDSMLRFAGMHLILTAANKAKSIMLYSLLSLGMNLVLNITLYYLLGMIGPAIATLICALTYTLLILRKSIRALGAGWRQVFDLREMLGLVASLILLWGVCFGLNHLLLHLTLPPFWAMLVSMAVFGCSALAMHFKKIRGVLTEINTFRLS